MSVTSIWGAVKTAAGAGILQGGYPFARNVYMVGANVPTFAQSMPTIAAALAIAVDGDVIMLGPQQHAEGNLVLAEGKDNITIIGMGNRGACYIEAPTAGDEGLQILGDDCTLINVGVASDATGDYSLKVGSSTVSPARFRAYQCKFEGNEGANPAGQVLIQGAADVILEDCELAWGVNGLIGDANLAGFPTEILVRNCWFHDLTTVHVGIAAADHWVNLWLRDNYFDLDESGVAPTDFILLSDNANIGVITGNRFASATNATGTITIGSGLIYPTNYTEAGPSAARPA
jgi:hypothetical protein